MLKVSRGRVWKAQKVVIYGPEGIGKSTFAAQFPEPVFIDTEGSTNLMDVARLPRPTSWSMMLSMIKEIKNTPGFCKTLVIDTIDWAEQLCVEHICAIHDKKGIEDFGYGNGYVYAKEEFGRFLNQLQDIIDIGINVVLTAHSHIRKFEQPNEIGSYDRYELKLGKKTSSQTSPLVKEWADMVLFVNYKVHVVEIEKKKKSSGGARVMYTTHHPSWDAKNRHDLKPELPFEYAQIAYCIPNHIDQPSPASPQPEELGSVSEANKNADSAVITKPKNDPPAVSPNLPPLKVATPPPADLAEDIILARSRERPVSDDALRELPGALADLMRANEVTVGEIQQVVSSKGYYPKDTPLKNYDPGFIDGVLVGAWEQVLAMIKTEREIPFN